MKNVLRLCILLSLPVKIFAGENEQRVESPITSVIVYLSGAEVTHTKHITLTPGRNELHFVGLSSKLLPKSIQFTTTGDVSLLAISNRIDYLYGQKKNDSRAQQLNDSLIMMSDALAITMGQIEAYQKEKQMLDANQSIGGTDKGVVPADLKITADFYFQRTLEINTELVKLRRKQVQQQDIVNRLNAQYYEANQRASPPMGEITVLVNAGGSIKMETDIILRYVVSDCGWAPSYDLIAEDVGSPINLKYRAKVFNNTNVDWKDVKLKLSTANPMQSASAPELDKWTLNFETTQAYANNYNPSYNQPAPASDGQPQTLSSQNLEQSAARQGPAGNTGYTYGGAQTYQQQSGQQYGQIQISELSAEFEIKLRYDIPSDAKPYIVDVTSYTLNAAFKYRCVPKIEREAFLMARITGWEDLDLVEGPANVYFGGTYVGQSYIVTRSVDDTLDLSLGRDKKLVVTRTKLKEFNNERPTSTTKKEIYSYEIQVKNTRKTMAQVELQDQVPISQESEIIVETTELSKGIMDPATGVVTWNLNIPPGETMRVVLTYSVKYPKNKAVKTKKYRTTSAPRF
jgi:uncharacterized protein (TIGR02231 family)